MSETVDTLYSSARLLLCTKFNEFPSPAPGYAAWHRSGNKSPEFRTVIGCLTIAIQDARVLNIALERIMLGRPMHYLDEQIKQATASSFGAEARP